jgi:hypothetical protein
MTLNYGLRQPQTTHVPLVQHQNPDGIQRYLRVGLLATTPTGTTRSQRAVGAFKIAKSVLDGPSSSALSAYVCTNDFPYYCKNE